MSHIHLKRLYKAALGLCICCAKPMPQPKDRRVKGWCKGRPISAEPTIEHVFPRNPYAPDMRRMAALRRFLGDRGTTAPAHEVCNRRKGNRPPTACEVIFLTAVQDRVLNLDKHGKPRKPARAIMTPPMPAWALEH